MIRIDQSSAIASRRLRGQEPGGGPQFQRPMRTCFTPAEAIDAKLKVALRQARSLVFRSPDWPLEYEEVDECC